MLGFLIAVFIFILTVPLSAYAKIAQYATDKSLGFKDKVTNGSLRQRLIANSKIGRLQALNRQFNESDNLQKVKIAGSVFVNLSARTAKTIVFVLRLAAILIGIVATLLTSYIFVQSVAIYTTTVIASEQILNFGNELLALGEDSEETTSEEETETTEKTGSASYSDDAFGRICEMGEWYCKTFGPEGACAYYKYTPMVIPCELIPDLGNVRNDCTGFMAACVAYTSNTPVNSSCSGTLVNSYDYYKSAGWQGYSWKEYKKKYKHLSPGDFIVINGHAELVLSYNESDNTVEHFGWGGWENRTNIHYKSPEQLIDNGSTFACGYHKAYCTVFHYEGDN